MDDEEYLESRGAVADEPRSESYSRSHRSSHQSERYMPRSSLSSRSSYELDRESSSSRTHREPESWPRGDPPHERYDYPPDVGHHRTERNVSSRGDDWPTQHDEASYPEPRDNWSQHYEQSYPMSNYADPHWGAGSMPPYESRGGPYEPWRQDGDRSRARDEQSHVAHDDKPRERGNSGWRRDQKRERGRQHFKSDSGWDARRKGKEWDENSRCDESSSHRKRQPNDTEDRSWEPGPSWQRSNTEQQNQRHNGYRHNYKNQKGPKRQPLNKQKRDRRQDDGNLNNWQRREIHPSKEKNKTMDIKKHPRSQSRSRSRSPTESYRSPRSSRGRSRSRSTSPAVKRRRRNSSSMVAESRTPSDRGRSAWVPRSRHKNYPSRSPSPARTPESLSARRRSISSASSISTDRSPSGSPPPRPRAVHRLPLTSSATISPTTPRTGNIYPRHSGQRNGKHQANNKHFTNDRRTRLVHSPSVDVMPPPDIIPASHTSRTAGNLNDQETIAHSPQPSPSPQRKMGISASAPTRIASAKNAGFKPIGQANSSLKKFFPSDDDDMDLASDGLMAEAPLTVDEQFLDVEKSLAGEDDLQVGDHLERHDDSPRQLDLRPPRHSLGERKETSKDSSKIISSGPCTPSETVQDREADSPSGTRSRELYKIVSQVGEGTFGKVYKAQNMVTKMYVALKRIRMEAEKDGFPVTAMREIKLLQSLRHENVVRLYEMMVSNGVVYMVFEYMDHDLTGILSQTQFTFTPAHLKSLCQQMLAGLAYLHHKGVIHRDIKGSNILVNNRGELKLADFGLARFYHKRRQSDYTNRVITLWYRPPELLFGATIYGAEVDMWSAGCIMLELFTKKPVFQGNDEIHQLDVVYKIFGTPTVERWPSVMNLPWYELIKPKENIPNHFRELFQKWMSPAALDLAERLLTYDPSRRISAVQALEASYFLEEEPPAERPVGLSTLEGEWHELETKRERAKKRKKETAA